MGDTGNRVVSNFKKYRYLLSQLVIKDIVDDYYLRVKNAIKQNFSLK